MGATAGVKIHQGPQRTPHRPIAVLIGPPCRPERGGALTYPELVYVLAEWRKSKGISQLALDQRIGWTDGQTGKYEIPHADVGRIASWKAINEWLIGLGLGIALVPLD